GSTTRHFYHYSIDSASNTINLENKNPHYLKDKFKLQFERPNENTIRLFGVDAEGDSLQVVLHRIDKKYLYEEAKKAGRRGRLILWFFNIKFSIMSNEKLNQQKDVRVNDQESGNSRSVTRQPKPWTLFQKIAF